MTAVRINTEERKKLIADLWIIGIVAFLALGIVVLAMQNGMNDFAGNHSIPVVLRVLVIGLCGQFAVSGLGISIVCLIRKQRFREFGLNTKNLLPALLLSLLCCVPELTYYVARGYVSGWCPLSGGKHHSGSPCKYISLQYPRVSDMGIKTTYYTFGIL